MLRLHRNEQGFTLVEMLVVLAITMLMTAISVKGVAAYKETIHYEQAEVLHELVLREAQVTARATQQLRYARFDSKRRCMAVGSRTLLSAQHMLEEELHCYPMPHVNSILFGEGRHQDAGFSFSKRGHMSNSLDVFAIHFEDGHRSIFRVGMERGRIWPAGY